MVTASPEHKVYVCYPEEPFSFINLNGKLKQFLNGRMVAHIDGLTEDDIEWFLRRNTQLGTERYIVFVDAPSATQMADIFGRCAKTATEKATADNPGRAVEDARLMADMMLRDPDIQAPTPMPAAAASILDQVRKAMPSTADADPAFSTLRDNLQHQEADARAIAQALDSNPDLDSLETVAAAPVALPDAAPETPAAPRELPSTAGPATEPQPPMVPPRVGRFE